MRSSQEVGKHVRRSPRLIRPTPYRYPPASPQMVYDAVTLPQFLHFRNLGQDRFPLRWIICGDALGLRSKPLLSLAASPPPNRQVLSLIDSLQVSLEVARRAPWVSHSLQKACNENIKWNTELIQGPRTRLIEDICPSEGYEEECDIRAKSCRPSGGRSAKISPTPTLFNSYYSEHDEHFWGTEEH